MIVINFLIFLVPLLLPIIFMIGVGYIAYYVGIKLPREQTEMMQDFAEENNLNYIGQFTVSDLVGRVFSSSYNTTRRATSDALTGTLLGHDLKIFNYQHVRKQGRHSKVNNFTICEIDIGETKFPYIFLQSKSMPAFSGPVQIFGGRGKDVQISLEDEFRKTYSLWAEEDYEIEVLQIFTKEILLFLQETGSHFSIEFAENKMYIYDDRVIRKKEELEQMFDLARKMIEKTDGLLVRLKNDFDSLHEYYKK